MYDARAIVTFLLVGLVAGWLGALIAKGKSFGLGGNLIVGVMGALLGGLVFPLLGIGAHNIIGQLILAVLGSVAFVFLISRLDRK